MEAPMFDKNTNETVIIEQSYSVAHPDDSDKPLVSVSARSVNNYTPSVTLNFHVPGRKNPVATLVSRQALSDLRDMLNAVCEDLS
jgi:hypothetical protein